MRMPKRGDMVTVPTQYWEVTDFDVDPDGTIWIGIEPVMGLTWVKPEDIEIQDEA